MQHIKKKERTFLTGLFFVHFGQRPSSLQKRKAFVTGVETSGNCGDKGPPASTLSLVMAISWLERDSRESQRYLFGQDD